MKMATVRALTISTLAIFSIGALAAAQDAPASVSPLFGVALPSGYRDWQVVSVAHEAGDLNDVRAILGNSIAMQAFRTGRRPFPDGTIIARLAWKYESSPRNDAIFGKAQSFVAGAPTNVQIEVKDSRRYAATGGWGYGQFVDGRADPSEALMKTCVTCHSKLPAPDDRIFTSYAP